MATFVGTIDVGYTWATAPTLTLPITFTNTDVVNVADPYLLGKDIGLSDLTVISVSATFADALRVRELSNTDVVGVATSEALNGEFLIEVLSQVAARALSSMEILGTETIRRRSFLTNLANKAVSYLDMIDIVSMEHLDGNVYVTDGDSIYVYDDMDAEVASKVTLAMADFGYRAILKDTFLGVKGGKLHVKITDDHGAERVYGIEAKDVYGDTKLRVGRGVQTQYVVAEITNPDGDDFALTNIKYYPVVLTRRERR